VTLGPGARALVVKNRAALEARYGSGLNVVGTFADTGFDNAGQRIVLRDAQGLAIHDFTYSDRGAWPGRADGDGSSLEIIDPEGDYRDGRSWRPSSQYGGSPGRDGGGPVDTVVINEVLSRSSGSGVGPDRIELLNVTDRPVDLSGWYLSDSIDQLDRFVMPAGTTIDGGDYLVLTSSQLGFGLSGKQGEDVWLVEAEPGGPAARFVDQVRFGGAEPGVSFGRWPSGQPGSELFPMTRRTFGGPNSGPVAGDVVISEVHYQPRLALFEHNFDDGTAGAFTPKLGNWTVQDGQYKVTPGAEGDTISTIAGLGPLAGPVRIGASVTVPTRSGFRTNAALIFDYYGPDNFKFASVHAKTGRWRIGQRDEEKWRVLAERKEYVPADASFEMVLEIAGSVATLRLDGVEKATYDFGVPLGGGSVGLGSKSGSALFDNVRVELPSEAGGEFVELASVAGQPVSLAGWRLAGGVEFAFPAGTTIEQGAALVVVGFDPDNAVLADAFRARYGAGGDVRLVGPYTGRLDNGGATVALVQPLVATGAPEGFTLVDRASYDDQPPWPAAADGPALARRAAAAFGDFATSWIGRRPTPGYAFVGPPGDMDQDGTIDADDLDDFVLALRNPPAYAALRHLPAALAGDLDGDGDLDFDDIDELLDLLAAARAGVVVQASRLQ